MKLAAAVVLLVVILLAQETENTRHGYIGGDGTVHEGEGYRKALRRLRRERGPTDFRRVHKPGLLPIIYFRRVQTPGYNR